MIETTLRLINKLGLHARAAAKLVSLAQTFESDIELERNGRIVNAKSIMGVMMLAAACGITVIIRLDGSDMNDAFKAIEALFQDRFGEEE